MDDEVGKERMVPVFGFTGALLLTQIVFIVLKLTGHISLGWTLTFLPIIILCGLYVLVFIIMLIMLIVILIVGRNSDW